MCPKRRVYNNGTINKMFVEGEQPEGWTIGMSEVIKKSKQAKASKTNLERYGTSCTWQSEEVKEKIRQTNLKRYGFNNAAKSEEVKKRAVNTNRELYGSDYTFQSDIIKEKSAKTNLERYGHPNAMQSEEVKIKARNTNLERYGYENPSQVPEFKEKRKQTNLKLHGVDHPWKLVDKRNNTMKGLYGGENPTQCPSLRDKINETCLARYDVMWPCQIEHVRLSNHGSNSGPNTEFEKKLIQYGFKYKKEFNLSHFTYDFKIGNTLIEINPFATHNTLWSPYNPNKGVSPTYHLDKTLTAEKSGYHCIHIFDWDNQDDILRSLSSTNPEDIVSFCPLDGNSYWMYIKPYLSDMTPKIIDVIQEFIKNNHVVSLTSRCDRCKLSNDIYNLMGFQKISAVSSICHWYNPKTCNQVISFSEVKDSYPVYDCGVVIYELKVLGDDSL